MTLQLSNIRQPVSVSERELSRALAQQLNISESDLIRWRILRKSLDARSRRNLQFVYSVVIELPDDVERTVRSKCAGPVQEFVPTRFEEPAPGHRPLSERPVIIGTGPAGLLAGYYLALRGYRPLLIERGPPVKERVAAVRRFDAGGNFDAENNYLFGEGGAGTFSDGKLTCRSIGAEVDWVLRQFVQCGAAPTILYEHRPHLGSNRLPMIVRNLRRRIEIAGGTFQFGCRLENLSLRDGHVEGIVTSSGFVAVSQLILAIGHSARDTYRMLYDSGLPMSPKAFQLGLRIEQPQDQVNRHVYGRAEYLERLGAANYTLVARGQRNLYTFCMCAGGTIIPSVSEAGTFCTNGMSRSRHDTLFANSGLVVTLEPNEFGAAGPLGGVELQQRYESVAYHLSRGDYRCPIQRTEDFLSGRTPPSTATYACSYQRGTVPADLTQVLPPPVIRAIRDGLPIMNRKWQGDFLRHSVLVGPEMRGSAPLRIDRDNVSLQSPAAAGLYPVGEGAGYAGGIISAAVDGLKAAMQIIRQFAPLEPSQAGFDSPSAGSVEAAGG